MLIPLLLDEKYEFVVIKFFLKMSGSVERKFCEDQIFH